MQEALSAVVGGQKTAGRRMGMILEILTFLFFQSHGLGNSIRKGNQLPSFVIDATHETDFSFHPVLRSEEFTFSDDNAGVGAPRHPVPSRAFPLNLHRIDPDGNVRTMKDKVVKGGLVNPLAVISIQEGDTKDGGNPDFRKICATITSLSTARGREIRGTLNLLSNTAYAKVECKRVGIELTADSAPQTIEKAKQAAYTADHASSYQSILRRDGARYGVLFDGDGEPFIGDYDELRRMIIDGENESAFESFSSKIFVFSEPDNWRGRDGEWKKDMDVLCGSFDWVMSINDASFLHFCSHFDIVNPEIHTDPVKNWILDNAKLGEIPWLAYNSLMEYVRRNPPERWFTVHSPERASPSELVEELTELAATSSRFYR